MRSRHGRLHVESVSELWNGGDCVICEKGSSRHEHDKRSRRRDMQMLYACACSQISFVCIIFVTIWYEGGNVATEVYTTAVRLRVYLVAYKYIL